MQPSRMIRRYAGTRWLWLFAAACASQETSCPVEPLPPGMCAGFFFGGSHPCVGLEVSPRTGAYGSAVLKGDTLRMYTSSDSGYAAPVTWSITGEAATLVTGSEREETGFLRSASILVKGLLLGSATVTASHANPARTASSTITVVDSSIITQIVVVSMNPANVKVGASLYVSARLKDATGVEYRAYPDLWSTSDTTVATIQPSNYGAYVRGRSAGAVDVIASFLTVRGTLRITVVP